jgi:branched-chain amino acid aminotransferase
MILNGITRKHVLDICVENNIPVKMVSLKAANLSDYEAVFMTGTSPMVLPFNSIDDKRFKVRVPLIEKLRELYIARAEESIAGFRIGKS